MGQREFKRTGSIRNTLQVSAQTLQLTRPGSSSTQEQQQNGRTLRSLVQTQHSVSCRNVRTSKQLMSGICQCCVTSQEDGQTPCREDVLFHSSEMPFALSKLTKST
ncbi:hypothetical protein FQA47_011481 [Oryzias melastigma]|uniref:Uncharacterized protein n=1 Tax=Oryzias melastigma TaxID=30732 RepID=A0A834KU70_ORYME|nr:hypothetical protein FQA47_011481 [Oryzias melastigma]